MALRIISMLYFVTSMLPSYGLSQERNLCQESYCWQYNYSDGKLNNQTTNEMIISENCYDYKSNSNNMSISFKDNVYQIIGNHHEQSIIFNTLIEEEIDKK
jgi:hypothetical protein